MKTFFKVMAWIGVGFIALGVVLSFYIMWALMINPAPPSATPTFGPGGMWLLIVPIDIVGLGLILIGGLVARPKYLWLVCVIIGLLHIMISVPQNWGYLVRRVSEEGFVVLIFSFNVLPGLIAIFEGILVKVADIIMRKQRRI